MVSTRVWTVLLVIGMLLTGTINTLTMKILFTIKSIDSSGELALFNKPWFGTLNMLLAMFFVGIIDKAFRICRAGPRVVPDDNTEAGKPLLGEEQPGRSWLYKVLMVSIPALMDLLATAFACIGIMYLPASIWQMLRGACIIFSAIFSVTFLKRKMANHNWIGLAIVILGVVGVGYAGVLGNALSSEVASKKADASPADDGGSSSGILFGMTMVLLGQIFQAGQVVAEEFLMKEVDLPAMQIIGWEGAWGSLMMIVLVYPALWLIPGSDHGHYEDAWDTWVMLTNSSDLVNCFLIYLFSCATFNATGIAVTGALSAVHRMMLDASRTTVIWAFGLVAYSYYPGALYAEAWTVYSPLQLLGFLVLVAGQAIYGQVIQIPGVRYPAPSPQGTNAFASPAGQKNLFVDLPAEEI